MRIYKALGLEEEIISQGQVLNEQKALNKSGKKMGSVDLKSFSERNFGGVPFVCIREELLVSKLSSLLQREGSNMHKGATLVKRQEQGVLSYFSDGRTKRSDLFVVADGSESELRKVLMPETERSWKVRVTGYEYWSAFLPRPQGLEAKYVEMWGPNKRLWLVDCGGGLLHVSGTVQNTSFQMDKMNLPGLRELKRFHSVFSPSFTGEEVEKVFEFCARNPEYKAVNISYPSTRITSADMPPTDFAQDGVVLIGDAAHSLYTPYGFVTIFFRSLFFFHA